MKPRELADYILKKLFLNNKTSENSYLLGNERVYLNA